MNNTNVLTKNFTQNCKFSQLLYNIYINDLDFFIEKSNILLQKNNAQLFIKKIIKYQFEPQTPIIKYCRYGRTFIIGVIGTKEAAQKIYKTLFYYLKSSLSLQVLKNESRFIKGTDRKVNFLGFLLKIIRNNQQMTKLQKNKKKALEHQTRSFKRLKQKINKKNQQEFKKVKNKLTKVLKKKTCIITNINKIKQINPFIKLSEKREFSLYNPILKTFFTKYNKILPTTVKKMFLILDLCNNIKKQKNLNMSIKKKIKTNNLQKKPKIFVEITAPYKSLLNLLRRKGLITKKGRPQNYYKVISENNQSIIQKYASLGIGLLTYYRSVNNFLQIKLLVNYHIR